jgi:hypothetical protein
MRARSAIPDGTSSVSSFPSIAEQSSERPGAVQGALDWGAAERTLDGEDRSERMVAEGRTTQFTHDSGRFDPQILLKSRKNIPLGIKLRNDEREVHPCAAAITVRATTAITRALRIWRL